MATGQTNTWADGRTDGSQHRLMLPLPDDRHNKSAAIYTNHTYGAVTVQYLGLVDCGQLLTLQLSQPVSVW